MMYVFNLLVRLKLVLFQVKNFLKQDAVIFHNLMSSSKNTHNADIHFYSRVRP